jgi:flagellar motility protein MotE (MotC chaperone)
MSEENNIIEKAAEIAGMPLEMNIKDGELCIAPAEAGVMLLAAVAAWQEQSDKQEDYIDQLNEKMHKLRDENAQYRELLDECREKLLSFGFEAQATRIMNALWPVVGVLDDGTEVPVQVDWSSDGAQLRLPGTEAE